MRGLRPARPTHRISHGPSSCARPYNHRYRRYAGTSSSLLDLQYIELFDLSSVASVRRGQAEEAASNTTAEEGHAGSSLSSSTACCNIGGPGSLLHQSPSGSVTGSGGSSSSRRLLVDEQPPPTRAVSAISDPGRRDVPTGVFDNIP